MFRAGAQRSRNGTVTIRVKPMTAKCPANQEALDRLMEKRMKAEQNPNSNLIFTLKRAMNSLQACPHPITTQKQAMELKFVGTSLAKIICPQTLEPSTNVNVPSTKKTATTKTKMRQRTLASNESSNTAAAAAKKEQGPSGKQKVYETANLQAESLVLPDAPWKAILLVDGREHNSKNIVSRCKQSGIPCEERHLPIGDMAWIAQCDTGNGKVIEVLLGTILERKETSDLASSLFGTRYLEQRLRLQHSGLPQVLFLVEGNLNSVTNCPAETLRMAMMETRVQLGFQVVQTKHMDDTVRLLKGLHRRIVQRTFPQAFEELPTFSISPAANRSKRRRRRPTSLLELVFDTAPIPPFGTKRFITYPELKAKIERDREAGTRTGGAVYMAMLKQVASLSHKKCQAIAQQFPTLKALLTSYNQSDDPQRMVQDLPCDRQKVGPRSAAELCVACCTERDGSVPAGASSKPPPKPTSFSSASSNSLVRTTSLESSSSKPSPRHVSSSSSSNPAIQERRQGSSSLARTTSLESSTSSTFGSNCPSSSPPSPERKPAARPPLQPRDGNRPQCIVDCVDLTEDTPQKPKNPNPYPYPTTTTVPSSLEFDGESLPSINSSTPTKAPPQRKAPLLAFSGGTFASPAEDSVLSEKAKGPNVQHFCTPRAPKSVPPSSAWSSSASSAAFASPASVNTPAANPPARNVTLETEPYASSQSTCGSAGKNKHSQKASAKKPPRQSLDSSGSPLFSSPSSAPPSSQSSFGSTLPKRSRNQQPSVLEIIDSSDDDEGSDENLQLAIALSLSDSGSPNVEDGLRARVAKRLKRETIEILDD